MMDVKEDTTPQGQGNKFQAELRLYLEVVAPPGATLTPPPPEAPAPTEDEGWPALLGGQILLFLKYYDPQTEQLTFAGTHVASVDDTLNDLLPVLRHAKGFDATQQLAVYEEVEFDSLRNHPLESVLKDVELQSGDILVFQTLPLPEPSAMRSPMAVDGPAAAPGAEGADAAAAAAAAEHPPLRTIPDFFEHVKNRVVVHVHRLPPQQPHGQGVREKDRALELTMDKRYIYIYIYKKHLTLRARLTLPF